MILTYREMIVYLLINLKYWNVDYKKIFVYFFFDNEYINWTFKIIVQIDANNFPI